MPNPTQVEDVEQRFRPLSDAEKINAEAFLDDAWWMLLGRRPSLEADMDAETIQIGNVIRVVAHMVRRILMNPEGLLEEGLDDYRKRRDQLVSTGSLYVTDEELGAVTPAGFQRTKSVRLVAYGER